MAARCFDGAAFDANGRALMVGHPTGNPGTVVWRVRSGRLSRAASAAWPSVGAATDGEGVIVVGRDGQTLAVDDAGVRTGSVTDRRVPPVLRGVTQLASGIVVAFGIAGQIYRRTPTRWEPWSVAPPLPRGIAVKTAIALLQKCRAIAGVAGHTDVSVWAFGVDGAAWSRSGKGWRPVSLPAERRWTCATSRPDGVPVVAGPGLALVGAGVKWRELLLGELKPIAIAAFDEAIFAADGASVWRIDGRAPRLVLAEPVESLSVTRKGVVAVAARAAFVSIDGARWARLA